MSSGFRLACARRNFSVSCPQAPMRVCSVTCNCNCNCNVIRNYHIKKKPSCNYAAPGTKRQFYGECITAQLSGKGRNVFVMAEIVNIVVMLVDRGHS